MEFPKFDKNTDKIIPHFIDILEVVERVENISVCAFPIILHDKLLTPLACSFFFSIKQVKILIDEYDTPVNQWMLRPERRQRYIGVHDI